MLQWARVFSVKTTTLQAGDIDYHLDETLKVVGNKLLNVSVKVFLECWTEVGIHTLDMGSIIPWASVLDWTERKKKKLILDCLVRTDYRYKAFNCPMLLLPWQPPSQKREAKQNFLTWSVCVRYCVTAMRTNNYRVTVLRQCRKKGNCKIQLCAICSTLFNIAIQLQICAESGAGYNGLGKG